jgi:hypothetical protein
VIWKYSFTTPNACIRCVSRKLDKCVNRTVDDLRLEIVLSADSWVARLTANMLAGILQGIESSGTERYGWNHIVLVDAATGLVTRKVTLAAARIRLGLQQRLKLGNLDAQRDWGFAGDYVQAMWLMLQRETPEDYVIATGVQHSVRELVQIAFDEAGLDWREHVDLDPGLLRPADISRLVGDASKARSELGWAPKTSFEELVRTMTRSDLERLSRPRD